MRACNLRILSFLCLEHSYSLCLIQLHSGPIVCLQSCILNLLTSSLSAQFYSVVSIVAYSCFCNSEITNPLLLSKAPDALYVSFDCHTCVGRQLRSSHMHWNMASIIIHVLLRSSCMHVLKDSLNLHVCTAGSFFQKSSSIVRHRFVSDWRDSLRTVELCNTTL